MSLYGDTYRCLTNQFQVCSCLILLLIYLSFYLFYFIFIGSEILNLWNSLGFQKLVNKPIFHCFYHFLLISSFPPIILKLAPRIKIVEQSSSENSDIGVLIHLQLWKRAEAWDKAQQHEIISLPPEIPPLNFTLSPPMSSCL